MTAQERPTPPPPYEALEALAAGELPAEEAQALRARLETEPAWRDAWSRVVEVEALLRAEPLLPVPLGVLQRTLARTLPARRERPARILGRVAAAVLVFAASWFAFAGDVAAMSALGPRGEVADALPAALVTAPVPDVWTGPAEPGGPGGEALGLLAGGLALLGAGLAVTMRMHRRAARPQGGGR